MLKKINTALYFILPGLVLISLFWGNLSEYPQYVHAWANYDYLALAHGFINNGFDFFHPQTYVLNPQFPDNFTVPRTGITSVDFPINAYLVGILMYLFDTKSTAVFYIYQLSYLTIGIGFAGMLFERIAKNNIIPWVGIVFMFSSTVFIYYSHSFLPSVTAISNVFIGLYFLHCYFQKKTLKSLCLALFFLTLAALTRTPFTIPLIAILVIAILKGTVYRASNKKLVIGLIISFSCIVGYFLYNSYLRATYGSMFLGSIMPINSMKEFSNLWQQISKKWIFEYFSSASWSLLLGLTSISFVLVLVKSDFKKIVFSNTSLFLLTYLLGAIMYSWLMGEQFYHHDYYFLDTFFIVLSLCFVYLLACLVQLMNKKLVIGTYLTLGLILMCKGLTINDNLGERRIAQNWDVYQNSISNFTKNKHWFDSLNLPKNEKILALNPYIPNALFSIIEQPGYIVLTTSKNNIKQALNWDFAYILIQDDYFENDLYNNYPGILTRLKKFSSGNGLSLYIKKEISTILTSNNLVLGREYINHLFIDSLFQITTDNLYANSNSIELITSHNITIKCTAHFDLSKCDKDLKWVVDLVDLENHTIHYQAFNLSSGQNSINNEFKVNIPKGVSNPLTLKTYFWNKEGVKDAYIKDFALLITE
jgi:hypothetical protein